MMLRDQADRNRGRGFSLVEVMVVLVLLLTSLAALMRWQTVQRRETSLAAERIAATLLAANKLETLRGGVVSGTNITPLAGEDGSDTLAESPAMPGSRFERTWRTAGLESDPSLVAIDVRVRWRDERGRNHEIGLSTVALALEATRNEPGLAGRVPLRLPVAE